MRRGGVHGPQLGLEKEGARRERLRAAASVPTLHTLAASLNTGLVWNLVNVPPYADSTIRDRMVYNTHRYSQSNSGHAFSDVLTEREFRAILEYLKTL